MQKSHDAAVAKFKDQGAQLQARIKELTDLHSASTQKLRDDFASKGKEKDEALVVAKSDVAKLQEEVKTNKASLESLKSSHAQEVKKLQARAEDGGKGVQTAQAELTQLREVVEGESSTPPNNNIYVLYSNSPLRSSLKDWRARSRPRTI